MKFKLHIDHKDFPAGYTGRTCRLYREQFGHDLLKDVGKATPKFFEALSKMGNGDQVGFSDIAFAGVTIDAVEPIFLERIVWAVLASEDQAFPLYEDWVDSVESYSDIMTSGVSTFLYIITGNQTTVTQDDDGNLKKK